MPSDKFVHLHVHSEGSLLDGFGTPEEIVLRSKDVGQESIALTDHGTMSCALSFFRAGRAHGINPLIGMESYVTEDMDIKTKEAVTYHMGIIARNNVGLEKLYRLSYWAWNKGFYNKPRFDLDTFYDYFGGQDKDLLVLSGCMDGLISRNFLAGNHQLAEQNADKLASTFSHLLIEIQPWNPPELNEYLVGLADKKGLPLVVTCDTHYCSPEDKLSAEVSLVISQLQGVKKSDKDYAETIFGATRRMPNLLERINTLWPNRRLRFDKYDNYIHSLESLKALMEPTGIIRDDIYENTYLATRDIELDIKSRNYFPKYSSHMDSDKYLRELAFDNMRDMGLDSDEYKDRLNEELKVIEKLQFSDYFLVVWDIVHHARNKNIWVGPGRGSVGGSLLAYVLGITRVDPMKHGLLFWRFLNIDLDYEPEFEEMK